MNPISLRNHKKKVKNDLNNCTKSDFTVIYQNQVNLACSPVLLKHFIFNMWTISEDLKKITVNSLGK